MKDFALGLGLKQRQKATRKWPIDLKTVKITVTFNTQHSKTEPLKLKDENKDPVWVIIKRCTFIQGDILSQRMRKVVLCKLMIKWNFNRVTSIMQKIEIKSEYWAFRINEQKWLTKYKLVIQEMGGKRKHKLYTYNQFREVLKKLGTFHDTQKGFPECDRRNFSGVKSWLKLLSSQQFNNNALRFDKLSSRF